MSRLRLSRLGFSEPLDNLDCVTADALLYVDAEVEALKASEMKKAANKKSSKARKR